VSKNKVHKIVHSTPGAQNAMCQPFLSRKLTGITRKHHIIRVLTQVC